MSSNDVFLSDDSPLEGLLSVNLVFNNGPTIPFLEEDLNLITNRSKAKLLAFVYDKTGTLEPDPILTFRVGQGGTLDGTTGIGSVPGTNPRPLHGEEEGLFAELNPTLYGGGTSLFHNMETAMHPNQGDWQADTTYAEGAVIASVTLGSQLIVFEAANAGTTGAVEPTWNETVGGSTPDGSITWITRYREFTSTSVKYSFSISSEELNGYNISEVAMFKTSGEMFNIKTFPSIPKSSAFSIQFIWTIRYA